MTDIHQQKILILDFGSQYTQLIARRVREAGVYSEIVAHDADQALLQDETICGFILSGSHESTTGTDAPSAPEYVFTAGKPVLGICYGMQTMARQLGGQTAASEKKEFGHADLNVLNKHPLLMVAPSAEKQPVWMSHGDKVTALPEGFHTIAESANSPIAAMANDAKRFYGLQFHPEVTHSHFGKDILIHFLHGICGCQPTWTAANIVEDALQHIQETVGSDEVILGLSGGVDSAVVAAMCHRAIGSQLKCVMVDTGLLRLNEVQGVRDAFDGLGLDITIVDAKTRFLEALSGISEPEEKRKRIGHLFIDVFQEEAQRFSNAKFLAQGTIYPDVVESAKTKTQKGTVIKSHHNVGGLPEKMDLKLLEPLRELFKDEVRQVGIELGLPRDLVYRHPFPGPGLAVRILGEIKSEYIDMLQQADKIFIDLLREFGYYDKVSQAFAVFLPVKSVGVMGDARQYDYCLALRAVETVDFMTARWAHLPYDLLEKASSRIINEVNGIARVTYDISSKPPATIEWE